MTTVMDIAKRSGFSTATVSRAFNGTASVHQSTHARIMAAARELGDDQWEDTGGTTGPRPMGRPRGSLSKSDTVDIIVFVREGVEPLTISQEGLTLAPVARFTPDSFFSPRFSLSTDYYRHIIEGAVSVLSANGMKAVQQMRSELLSPSFNRELRTSRRRGMLLLGEPSEEVQRFADQCERPLVLVDILGITGRPVVATDNAAGIQAMARHLIDLGHRSIGFAGHSTNPSYKERRLSFYGQMLDAGIPVRPEWQYDGSSHVEDVAKGVRSVLARKNRPTAVMCCSDWVAMGVIRAARALGLEVPGDLSVGGFDDVDVSALVSPPLTTIHAPLHALGAKAVRLLLGDMRAWEADAPWGSAVRLGTNLIVRGTTAVPRKNTMVGKRSKRGAQ